jgi:8-oxo-dGTP diphosphatase
MAISGVNVIVLNDEGDQVLLQRRRDFRIWTLPGGHTEAGESWEESAVRETFEETGYQIAVDRQVGIYKRPQLPGGGGIATVCTGHVTGGHRVNRGPETVGVRWFEVSQLPRSLPAYHRQALQDALAEYPSPIHRTQRFSWLKGIIIQLLFGVRNLRNWLLGPPRQP